MPISAQTKEEIVDSFIENEEGKDSYERKLELLQDAVAYMEGTLAVVDTKLTISEELTEYIRPMCSNFWGCLRATLDTTYAVEETEESFNFPVDPTRFLIEEELIRSIYPDFDKVWFPIEYINNEVRKGSYFNNDYFMPALYTYELTEEDVIIPPSMTPFDVPAHWNGGLLGVLPMIQSMSSVLSAPEPDRSSLLNILKLAFDSSVTQFNSNYSSFLSSVEASFVGKYTNLTALAGYISSMNSIGIEANHVAWANQINSVAPQVILEFHEFVKYLYACFNKTYSRSSGFYWDKEGQLAGKNVLLKEIQEILDYKEAVENIDVS